MAGRENFNDTASKSEVHKCKICKIKCPDIHSYVEHLESKDHKKGVMKEKYGEKYLEAKAKLDNVPKDQIVNVPEKKPALPKDNPKPKLDKGSSSESSDEDDVYTCEICRKICTGFLNYQLHLEGQKHHKNVQKAKLMKQLKENNLIPTTSEEKLPEQQSLLDRIMTNTKFASSDIECKTCQKKCCGPAAFKQHCKSAGHHKKLALKNLMEEMKSESLSAPLHDDEDTPFAFCDVCKKCFSGLLPYQQHMESITHLKQAMHVEQLSKIKDLIISSKENSNKFQCKECGKSFSGPVPFKAHLKSLAHEKLKKKSAQMEYLQEKYPEMVKIPKQQDSESEDTDEEDGILLGCEVCHLVCSGPEAARDHFASAKHKKAVKKTYKFQKYMKQQQQTNVLTEASGSQRKLKTAKRSEKADLDSDSSEFDIIQDV